ncbi:MAG: type II toxin-antitoxin system YafQ family toxin [Acidobacteriota bacterium]
MRKIEETSQFKKDLKKLANSGKYNPDELLVVIGMLAKDILLPKKYHDHSLAGSWKDHRDCHIRPDWILIYKLELEKLILIRTGSHSTLFG